ncbi:formimidoylglutamate deiminase [Sphingosinicellaceae bacterium]|nr:formimidoylglutamate deiminase [Sphingosinicellaceae bacterium]
MAHADARLHARSILLPAGWREDVRLTVSGGIVTAIETGIAPGPRDELHGAILPGMGNLHSHAFQRGMAGLTEARGVSTDNFWTWRETMFRFVNRIGPDELMAVAALAYAEMLESGFTRVGEFHYLHHDTSGVPFADPAEMSRAIVAAAAETGIGLTLLPVYYAHAGFGGTPLTTGQRRFGSDLDSFTRLLEAARAAAAALPDAVVGIAPHSLRAVTADELDALMPLAADGPIHLHVAEQTQEVEDCVRWSGARPVEWLLDHAPIDARWCLVHATHMTDAETVGLAASGAVAGLCPITEANLGDGIFPAKAFLSAGGRIGIGSDSNVRVDLSEELRLLEYGQRLSLRGRNILSKPDELSTGENLFRQALEGGGRALGIENPSISVGQPADFVSLDVDGPAFQARGSDKLLDSWIFAAGDRGVDCVWRRGCKMVQGGRHVARGSIVRRYATALAKLLA